MKVIIQRVTQSRVKVNEEVVSSIGKGLLVLVGISKDDTKDDLNYMVKKILNLRIFDDDTGKRWSKSVVDKKLEILCVSQFTLCHSLKGNKLDFHYAMKPDESKSFYENFLEALGNKYEPEKIKDGKFGAYMQVESTNDGPVTIQLSTNDKKETETLET